MSGAEAAGDRAFRRSFWRAQGATEPEADELVDYAASPLAPGELPGHVYPLADGPWVAAWRSYAAEAEGVGAATVLRRVLVQLRFPVRTGMSVDPAYVAATRRGEPPPEDASPLELEEPEGIRIFVHPTPAGSVPVVACTARADFESLVRAVTLRNEPGPVPASMGACTVGGYNNWARVSELRRAHESAHPEDWTGEGWAEAFRALVPRKDLYQDRFMILSSGPYSAVPASAVGLSPEAWASASLRLRLEHECTHYFTRQAFGSMRKSALDELIADYVGIVAARGRFRAADVLLFLGLEAFPEYREGGRLQNYRGTPPLGDGSFAVLQAVVKRAAHALEGLAPAEGTALSSDRTAQVITALARIGLEGLASDDAALRFRDALVDVERGAPARMDA